MPKQTSSAVPAVMAPAARRCRTRLMAGLALLKVIRHHKAEPRMDRNYLAHRAGDAVNAVLSRVLAAQKAAAALQWV
jgi:hypothetical protein